MIGIFGGTFDPIHYGHLRTALDVLQVLELDEVRFVPLRDPPHRGRPETMPEQRLHMLRAAVAGQPGFCVDERELKREGISFTVHTLRSLREELNDEPICLLMGADAFGGFSNWYKPEEIFQLAHLVVMGRPGEKNRSGPLTLVRGREVTDPQSLRKSAAGKVIFQTVTQLEISATSIREMVRRGLSPRYLLPDPVFEMIQQGQFYR